MAQHGGARNRSGPAPDPRSGRSERRRIGFRLLPPEGYQGRAPRFPLPNAGNRERRVWRELWKTPQACAWAEEPWRWRTIAMYVRWSVRAEAEDAPAATAVHAERLADRIGLSKPGLRENGWEIARDELADRRAATQQPAPPGPPAEDEASDDPSTRLKVVHPSGET
ncbi:MAG: hypothetical protein ACODAF_04440 [Actinomycetota bacterium]